MEFTEEKINHGIESINVHNETTLHSQLKSYFMEDGCVTEARHGRYIIDVIKDDLLIEIQTRNFSSIRKKIENLILSDKVLLVYPIIEEKIIVKIDKSGHLEYERKSPKKGKPIDVFNELIRIPSLVNEGNFSMMLMMIHVKEFRKDDGKGSWRRKGVSLIDTELTCVEREINLKDKSDFMKLVYGHAGKSTENASFFKEFNSKTLAKKLGINASLSRKILYSLKHMGAISECGKIGNLILYKVLE